MTDLHRRHRRGGGRPGSGRRRGRLSDRDWLMLGAVIFLAEIVAIGAVLTAVL